MQSQPHLHILMRSLHNSDYRRKFICKCQNYGNHFINRQSHARVGWANQIGIYDYRRDFWIYMIKKKLNQDLDLTRIDNALSVLLIALPEFEPRVFLHRSSLLERSPISLILAINLDISE